MIFKPVSALHNKHWSTDRLIRNVTNILDWLRCSIQSWRLASDGSCISWDPPPPSFLLFTCFPRCGQPELTL